MKIYLDKLNNKENLTFEESKSAFNILMNGKASEDEIFNFLTLLSLKGEVSSEIAGGVYVLREKSKRVNYDECIDTCGTGGDGMNTLNISTASALLLASIGIKVAKHGNKAVSSKCGSGDVLEALNININLEPNFVEDQINKLNFGFNPALVTRQVIGVFDKKLLNIFAEALKNLGIKFAWIVNSEDGLDEISPYEKTNVVQLNKGEISNITIDPKELNIQANNIKDLIGNDSKFNADRMIDIFKGEDNDFSKAVCLNAAAGLIVSEKYNDLKIAYNFTREFIKSGKAFEHLKKIQSV